MKLVKDRHFLKTASAGSYWVLGSIATNWLETHGTGPLGTAMLGQAGVCGHKAGLTILQYAGNPRRLPLQQWNLLEAALVLGMHLRAALHWGLGSSWGAWEEKEVAESHETATC